MKVIFVVDSLGGGGAERSVIKLANGVREAGYRVGIVSLLKRVEYAIPDGVDLVFADDYLDGYGELRKLSLQQALVRLGFDARQDVLVANRSGASRLVAELGIKRSVFFIRTNLSSVRIGTRKGLRRWNAIRNLRRIYHNQNIICVSKGCASDFESLNLKHKNLAVLHNPFPLDAIHQASLVYEPGIAPGYILHVARFHPLKRHDIVLQAYQKSGLSVPLVFLGKGEGEEQIRRWVDEMGLVDRVVFAGFHENPYPWMRNAMLSVCASDYEGFGNVLVESLACGTPVVSVDCPFGPRDILTGSLAEFLAPPGDTDALAMMFNRVAVGDYPDFQSVVANFSDEKIVSDFLLHLSALGF